MMRVPVVTERPRAYAAVTHDDFADGLGSGFAEPGTVAPSWPAERRQSAARTAPTLRVARSSSGPLGAAARD